MNPDQFDRHEDHIVVPMRRKIAYGMGAFSEGIMNDLNTGWVLLYYNTMLKLDTVKVGWALFFPRFYDAITDPIMGNISDNFRSRWGRRRPFILIGGPLCCLMFFLIWAAPEDLGERNTFLYLLTFSVGFYTFLTISGVPHQALGAELSIDYHERTRVYTVRGVCGSVGATFIIPFWQLVQDTDLFSSPTQGARTLILIYACLCAAGYVWVFAGTREEGELQKRPKMRLFPAFKRTFSNISFLILAFMALFLILGIYSAFPFGNYINIYYVFGGDHEAAGPVITVSNIVMQVFAFLGFFITQWLGVKLGKRNALLLCLSLFAIAPVSSWFLFTPENPWLQVVFYAIVLPTVPGVVIFPAAMIADVVDMDELQTGRRREGVFMSVYAFVSKLGFSGTTLWTSYCLKWVGFNPDLSYRVFKPSEICVSCSQFSL